MTRGNLDNVFLKMVEMYEGQPERIQHFTKVHSYAAYIGRQEKLDEKTMFILETAAYTHDIGIKKAEELYHASNGRLQQELGPGEAETMLHALHFPEDVIERVKYLIAHHHTYLGTNGHIAIGTPDIDAAVAYLEEKGLRFDPATTEWDENGKKIVYLDHELAGFALHLVRKELK